MRDDYRKTILSTALPTYIELRDVIEVVYGSKVASRFGWRGRWILRRVDKSALGSIDSLLPLAHLFVFDRSRFYDLLSYWVYSIEGDRPRWSVRSSDLLFAPSHEDYVPDTFVDFLHRVCRDGDPYYFNTWLARRLGCSPSVADAMNTVRLEAPVGIPLLPLSSFHLGLSPECYSKAAEMFDIYTSRLAEGEQDDVLMKYLLPKAYAWAEGYFVKGGADVSNLLAWQIVRAVVGDISIDQVVALDCSGASPFRVVEMWSRGMEVDFILGVFANDIDADMVDALYDSHSMRDGWSVLYTTLSHSGYYRERESKRLSDRTGFYSQSRDAP